uniref:GDNF family receptor alpha 2 n=1 Tax=Malurus cyaneus samueli TaxID=2593467 RepID=A0A8C5UH67_9PASS
FLLPHPLCAFSLSILRSLAGPPSPPGLAPPGWRVPVDCVRANELSAAGRAQLNTMLANQELPLASLRCCRRAPLIGTLLRCKEGMKKELQCLQIYWSIHMGLGIISPCSPPDPVPRCPRAGMDPATTSRSNHCLDAAKACNLNDNCKRLRSGYISTCSRELSATEPCSRRKCHKALRQFFDRVPSEFTFRLLFCSCQDRACAERRRQTIVPSCSYEDKEKQNCLDLRDRSHRDFTPGISRFSSGFDMTPNYVDASTTSITISPWCSCKGSGNMEEECEKFLRDFTENPCLRNAIQAFGNGTDVNLTEKSPVLPDDVNDSNTAYDTSVISTCSSLQVNLLLWELPFCGFFFGKYGKSVVFCNVMGQCLLRGWKRDGREMGLGMAGDVPGMGGEIGLELAEIVLGMQGNGI